MAWPCISRVCCLARFWSQLDKSDLAVPLTIHSYSDIEEAADEGAEAGGAPQQRPRVPTGGGRAREAPPALPASASAPSLQDSLAGPPGKPGRRREPFSAETQYRRDFRAWPLQKRDVLPCGGEARRAEPPAAPAPPHGSALHRAPVPAASHVYVLPAAGRAEAAGGYGGFRHAWSSSSPPGVPGTSSYRHEYRPWTGAKRSRPTKTKQRFIIPEDHFVQESSYKADFKIPEVKAKFSPNPSAVFQAPTRILNV